jgi:hypothetical protein
MVKALCLAAALAAGYGLRASRQNAETLPINRVASWEYYVTRQSFSEADHTKAHLNALGCEALTEWRVKYSPQVLKISGRLPADAAEREKQVRSGLKELDQMIDEFHGSEQEFVLVQELLYMLKYHQEYDRWLDVFLRLAYEHPTQNAVGHSLRGGLEVSRLAGREAEFCAALEHLTAIPFEFPAKRMATTMLDMARHSKGLSQ